jgi:hypothetical protein
MKGGQKMYSIDSVQYNSESINKVYGLVSVRIDKERVEENVCIYSLDRFSPSRSPFHLLFSQYHRNYYCYYST